MSVTLHMVASLDGFVGKDDNDVSWMDSTWSHYDCGEELSGDVLATIDCYIMGSRTYELAQKLGWAYGDTQVVVVTSRALSSTRESVEFYTGDLTKLLDTLGQKNVWLVGGPTLYQEFFRLRLVDEVCLTLVPIILGNGIAFFRGHEQKLRLKSHSAFKNGMIDLWYGVV